MSSQVKQEKFYNNSRKLLMKSNLLGTHETDTSLLVYVFSFHRFIWRLLHARLYRLDILFHPLGFFALYYIFLLLSAMATCSLAASSSSLLALDAANNRFILSILSLSRGEGGKANLI